MAKGGLGSGLDFLFDDNTADVQVKKSVRLTEIEPNRGQPRKNFSEESIAALADSIQQYGILQPILVRPVGSSYQIVAGERRWRAARMLGLDEVPVIIKELSDLETMQIALIENLQRENLNPIEEAMGYRDLREQCGMTQGSGAKRVGLCVSSVVPEALLPMRCVCFSFRLRYRECWRKERSPQVMPRHCCRSVETSFGRIRHAGQPKAC